MAQYIIVVKSADRAAANQAAKKVDTIGGERTFTVGLVPVGSPPGAAPTHYWCCWNMTSDEEKVLRDGLAPYAEWYDYGERNSMLALKGLTTLPSSI